MRLAIGVVVLLALTGCRTDQAASDPGAQMAADESLARRKAECQRLYVMLGDPKWTPQQIEAIRVSMNTQHCAGLAP